MAWATVVGFKSLSLYNVRKLQSQERLLAIEKGQPLPPEQPFDEGRENKNTPGAPSRRISYLRTAGIVCVATGVGMALFFGMIASVVHNSKVLCGVAIAFIPAAIGAGLLIDVAMQRRELAKAGGAQPPAGYQE